MYGVESVDTIDELCKDVKYAKGKVADWQLNSENYYYRNYKQTSLLLIGIGWITHSFLKFISKLRHSA